MPIEISPETERLVEQQIASGRFHSVDEIIQQGIRARESGAQSEERNRHREAAERTREFIANPIHLEGISLQELIEEGRRL